MGLKCSNIEENRILAMGRSCQINSSSVFLCCFLPSVHLATNEPRNGISLLAALGKLKNCGQYRARIFSDPFWCSFSLVQ